MAGFGSVKDKQSSTTQAGITGVAGNTAARTGDAETGLKPVFTQADVDKINKSLAVQTNVTGEFGKNAAKFVGDTAGKKQKELTDQATQARAAGNTVEADRLTREAGLWAEGGAYRVAMHIVAGAMGGGINGAAGAAASSLAAPVMDKIQTQMQDSLVAGGMNKDVAKATASLLTAGASAAIAGAAGGVQGATTGFNVDLNNRQLHPSEEKWLKTKAKEFAKAEGITEQQATERLTQQALKDVDYLWRAQLVDGDDAKAQAFLKATKDTFTNDLGERQKLFTATGQQLYRPEMFADTANPQFYKQFAQSGISRTLTAGLAKELKDSGIDLKNGAVDLAKAVKDNPGAAVNAVWNAVKGLPEGVVNSFKETGTAIGEGAAVALNKDISDKLNAIYGTDVAGAQQAMLAIRITLAVTGAVGTAKLATGAGDATVVAITKKLDDIAADKTQAKAIAERMKDIAINKEGDRFTGVAEKMVEAQKAGWKTADGKPIWPPENGKVPGTEHIVELKTGQRLDRYGGTTDKSSFLAPADTPIGQRALSTTTNLAVHDEYVVLKPFPVEQSRTMPWFGQEGMGTQFETKQGVKMTIEKLVEQGYLKKVN
jgi:filamentous hemagglutinin